MKNKIISLLLMMLIIINCIPVYASNGIVYSESAKEIEEIKAREKYFIEDTNSTIITEGMEEIDENSIDYSKITKIYAGMYSIMDYDELNNKTMQDCVESADSFYYIPITNNGKTALLNVQIRKPITESAKEILTDEEIEKFQETVGEWNLPVISIYDYEIDYKAEVDKVLKDNNISNGTAYFLGGISNTLDLVAVICTDNPDDTRFQILEQFESKTEGDGGSTLDKNVLYTFDEIKAFVSNEHETKNINSDGEILDDGVLGHTPTPDNNKIIIISAVSGVAVLAAAIAAVCIIKKKKNAKTVDEQ